MPLKGGACLLFSQGGADAEMEYPSSNSGEEGNDFHCLQDLFAGGDESESSEDDSASDREWKEAVRAAVETEIQYQVQLRLSLERKDKLGEGVEAHVEDIEESAQLHAMRGRRQQAQEPIADQPYLLTPEAGDGGEVHSAAIRHENEKKETENQRKDIQINKDTTKDAGEREEKEECAKVSQQRHQSVYDYVSAKYGAPQDQLQNLIKTGTYCCLSEEERARIGVDKRVRWPVERSITLPTPRHDKIEKQSKVPLEFFEPLLGQQRPLRNYSGPRPVIFDSQSGDLSRRGGEEGDRRDRGGGLIFESRFESGNLQQAMQV